MGCSHCFIEKSGPEGEHMKMSTFRKALDFAEEIWSPMILVSGGEPTEHPRFFDFLDEVRDRMFVAVVCSNGSFALDNAMYDRLSLAGVRVQVTSDARFYPRNFDFIRHRFNAPWIVFEDHIRTVFPCSRVEKNGLEVNRRFSACFNLRSAVRSLGLKQAMFILGMKGRVCSPSVDVDGSVRMGEMDTCHRIGFVGDSKKTIEKNIVGVKCDRCGLKKNLSPEHLEAIGEVKDGSR